MSLIVLTGMTGMSEVSIKIEVARGMDRVTDCINKGPLVPFSRGRGGGGLV